jgi:hypothetical protein
MAFSILKPQHEYEYENLHGHLGTGADTRVYLQCTVEANKEHFL